jgi:hypothetical protein
MEVLVTNTECCNNMIVCHNEVRTRLDVTSICIYAGNTENIYVAFE